eukprot:6483281-Amphidinium_carterae.1
MQIPPATRARLGETDLRKLAAHGKTVAGNQLRTIRRQFHFRYGRVPEPPERDLFGDILDSDRELPITWPPPDNWRQVLPLRSSALQVRPESRGDAVNPQDRPGAADEDVQSEPGFIPDAVAAEADALPLQPTPKTETGDDENAEGIDWEGGS